MPINLGDIAKKREEENYISIGGLKLSKFSSSSLLKDAKKKYNTFSEALENVSNYTDEEINSGINEAKTNIDYFKNKILNSAKNNNIETSKNKDLVKSQGEYRKDSLNNIYYDRYTPNNKYKKTIISENAKNSDKNYVENKEKFDTLIKNTNDYKEYEDYAYRALPLLTQAKQQREVSGDKTGIGDKIFAPIIGGLSEGLNNSFLPISDTYKMANGENIRTTTKTGLKGQKVMGEAKSLPGKIYASATYSLGNMLPSMVASTINPIVGTTIMATGTYKQAYNNSLAEGYTKEQANKYATANATLETALGKVLGGMTAIMGKSGLSNVISKSLTKVMSNKATRDILADMGSEFTEEYLQEVIDPWVRNKLLDENNEVKIFSEEALVAGLSGALSSGISNLPNYIANKNNISINQNQTNQTTIQEQKYSQTSSDTNNAFYSEKINNTKINNLRESASKYFDNTEQTHNFVSTLEKIVADKNYNVIFDDTLSNGNNNVNAHIKTLSNDEIEIRLNPNSNKSGEFLIMHELTHAIETDSMKKLVLDYASKHTDFNQALESLKTTYKTNDVSSEVLADISGQLFGNQEFIYNLSVEQPSIFRRIYNSIISLANKITGNSNEALFVKDLKNKWQEAYRKRDNNLNLTNYSIQTDNNGNKYVNVDTNQDIFEGKNLYEQNKLAKQYILENFKGKELLIDDSSAIVTRKTANEYTHPKTTLQKKDASSKMKASTELDNLLSVSKYKYSKSDDGRHPFAKDGWDYYETTFKVGDRTYTGLVNIAKNGNKKMLYDITNLKRNTLISSPVNTATESIGIPFSENNISQSNKNVKSDISTKYSMQSNQNNTQGLDNSSFSMESNKWQNYVEENYKSTGTKTNMQDIKLPKAQESIQKETKKVVVPLQKEIEKLNGNTETLKNKTLNPLEISKLTQEDANTTPNLPKVNRNKTNDGESKFYSNIKDKVNMLNEQQKHTILSQEEVQYYDKVTNKESLEKAFDKLNKNGKNETLNWFGKNSENADATDVAEGWILLKQYADNGEYDSMVEVAKKMRDIGTKAGQTVQAFNIMERMTPEGMVKYAQSELSEAYDKMVKNKSKEWIEKYRSDFDLKPNEVQFIMNNMEEISKMQDGYDKRVKLAEIQKIMTDKLPPQKGSGIKSWMRISMLFNPKTQVRNVAGNALIMPVNYFGDLFSNYADKIISKKTGVRTTGKMNVKAILKGFKEGAYQATNDYKKGINTKNMEGNRFEIGEGKSFNDEKLIGKSLNRVENMLNYLMDAGDRMFSQSSFENSLQNQMILNNTTEITQEMIDIATQESLSRTWNDNNNYTKFVLDIRKMLNKIGTENYGLGDILIPFAKTPANLTKAIVDYSPLGLVNTLIEGNNLRKSMSNGQFTAKMQHKFVQDLGKACVGTILYVAGYALAKADITSGESDDDKDTANFLKNALGINSYSIKIGNKTFTYDWAQPIAAPLSIMSNIVNSNNKEKALLEAVVGSLDTAGSILLEQSFLTSINEVLNDNDGVVSGLINQILELPSRAVPTFSKQIADLIDGTQRTSYEYGKPINTAVNNIKVKIPGLSKTLAPTIDTMGREVQKYGGKNNIFNVFLNPATVSTENISESAQEIYRLYKITGDKTIMPRVAPYYVDQAEGRITLNSKTKSEYQKISGSIIEESVENLLNNGNYQKLSDADKASIIKSIVDFSYNKAKEDVLDISMSKDYNKINKYLNMGGSVADYYINKEEINYSIDNPQKYATIIQITNYKTYLNYKNELDNIRDNTENKKEATIKYINSLHLNIPQKAMFIKQYYSSYNNYNKEIVNYINQNVKSIEEKTKILTQLGFTIKDGRVYW